MIAVITTGGTVASRKTDGVAEPVLGGGDLLEGVAHLAQFRVRNLMMKDSATLRLADMQAISDAIKEEFRDPDIRGVIVLHGTDSMEETSFLAELQQRDLRPVVFTGAQFTADHEQSDGPANIELAVRTVLDWSPEEDANPAGGNVRVAFGGAVFVPRGLYKASTDSEHAFAQFNPGGPMTRLPDSDVSAIRVDAVAVAPGSDSVHIDASVAAGARGVVLACPGSGNSTPEVVDAVRRHVSNGIAVIVTSRVPQGLLSPIYGGGGGGHDLVEAGAVYSHFLRSSQARILLAVLLASGADREGIRRAFG